MADVMSTEIDTWLWWLQSKVGIREVPNGSNRTPLGVEFGWNGVAWCCITASLALQHALGRRVLWTAGVADAWARAQRGENGLVALDPNKDLRVGDLPCFDIHGHMRPADMHIGNCINPGTQEWFEDIEGNWGNMVVRIGRDRTKLFGIIRPPWPQGNLSALGIPPRRNKLMNYFAQDQATGSTKGNPKGAGPVFQLDDSQRWVRDFGPIEDLNEAMYLCNLAGTRAPVPLDAHQIGVPQGAVHLLRPGSRARYGGR